MSNIVVRIISPPICAHWQVCRSIVQFKIKVDCFKCLFCESKFSLNLVNEDNLGELEKNPCRITIFYSTTTLFWYIYYQTQLSSKFFLYFTFLWIYTFFFYALYMFLCQICEKCVADIRNNVSTHIDLKTWRLKIMHPLFLIHKDDSSVSAYSA